MEIVSALALPACRHSEHYARSAQNPYTNAAAVSTESVSRLPMYNRFQRRLVVEAEEKDIARRMWG
jgi:hypothetical protein